MQGMAALQSEQQLGARAIVQNNAGSSQLTLLKTISWSGNPDNAGIPQFIMPTRSGSLNHLANPILGSKAAVVYVGTNAAAIDCAWVLAWDAPTCVLPIAANCVMPIAANKVYVFCDTKSAIEGLSDTEILIRLELQGAATSTCTFAGQKINANATIAYSSTLKMALVQAFFGLTP